MYFIHERLLEETGVHVGEQLTFIKLSRYWDRQGTLEHMSAKVDLQSNFSMWFSTGKRQIISKTYLVINLTSKAKATIKTKFLRGFQDNHRKITLFQKHKILFSTALTTAKIPEINFLSPPKLSWEIICVYKIWYK